MKRIKVGLGTCGISAGGQLVYDKLKEEIETRNLPVVLAETGCMGMCYDEVLVEIEDGNDSHLYSKVTVNRLGKIIEDHIINGKPIEEWIVKNNEINKEEEFLKYQKRIVLRNCGVIDPTSIEEYIANEGYKAIETVLKGYSPIDVIDTIIKSGLRGRGGGGFSTGMKWKFA